MKHYVACFTKYYYFLDYKRNVLHIIIIMWLGNQDLNEIKQLLKRLKSKRVNVEGMPNFYTQVYCIMHVPSYIVRWVMHGTCLLNKNALLGYKDIQQHRSVNCIHNEELWTTFS